MTNEKEITIKSFDGTILRGYSYGAGPALVLVNGLGTTASYWKYVVTHFSATMRVITYDLRGHGRSELPVNKNEVTIQSHARDLKELIAQLELSSPVIAGFSMGVQIVLQHYELNAAHVKAMLLVTGSYKHPISTFYSMNVPVSLANLGLQIARTTAPLYAPVWNSIFRMPGIHQIAHLIGAARASQPDMQPFYNHMATMHPRWFFRFALAANRYSAEKILYTIAAPVLIIGGGNDTFTPPSLSEEMAQKIPHAELFLLRDGTHTTLIQEPDRVIARIESFLSKQ